jgi:hypothetical protein
VKFDYTAAELPLQAGETITLHHEENGWYWATNTAGRSGWVPSTHIKPTSNDFGTLGGEVK